MLEWVYYGVGVVELMFLLFVVGHFYRWEGLQADAFIFNTFLVSGVVGSIILGFSAAFGEMKLLPMIVALLLGGEGLRAGWRRAKYRTSFFSAPQR